MNCKRQYLILLPSIIVLILIGTIYNRTDSFYTKWLYKFMNSSKIAAVQNKISFVNDENKRLNATVLLIYVYANTHSHASGSLKYFIEKAVREDDGVDYYFILQRLNNKSIDESEMPLLPKRNAYYIQHENICFDFGTIGWFLNEFTFDNPWIDQTNQTKKINLTQYKYFILLNSSIHGSFFPPYFLQFLLDYKIKFQKEYYWYVIFTRRINAKVKLVGSTISFDRTPHVQSYILVTDFIELTILLKPGADGGSQSEGIFGCYKVPRHAAEYGEIPSSNRIHQSGYMIHCLRTKYNRINFNQEHNHGCDRTNNPVINNKFDGVSLEPYEVVFVKFNDIEPYGMPRDRAKLYQKWIENTDQRIRSN